VLDCDQQARFELDASLLEAAGVAHPLVQGAFVVIRWRAEPVDDIGRRLS
jgi:hypothetical protein